jgi:tetratricopeptide (TPR) repeat protein
MIERSFYELYAVQIFAFIIFVFAFNLVLILLAIFSELINKKKLFRFLTYVDILFIISIIGAYFILKPERPKTRLAFLPTNISQDVAKIYQFALIEQLERNISKSNQKKFNIHSFWWTMNAIDTTLEDSVAIYKTLSSKIGTVDFIESKLTQSSSGFQFEVSYLDWVKTYAFSTYNEYEKLSETILNDLCQELEINKVDTIKNYTNLDYIQAKSWFYHGQHEKIIQHYDTLSIDNKNLLSNVYLARAYVQMAYKEKPFYNTKNNLPYAEKKYYNNIVKAQKRLYYYYNQNPNNFEIYNGLIELFLFNESYQEADDLIKAFLTNFGKSKTLIKDDPEILYYYSFLNEKRLEADGYKSKFELLEEILEINPFYEKALLRYSDLTFSSNRLNSDAVQEIFKVLEFYRKQNPFSDNANFMLSGEYLRRGDVINARRLMLKVYDSFKTNPRLHYDLGSALFYIGKNFELNGPYVKGEIKNDSDAFRQAIVSFKECVRLKGDIDAHLYLGELYRRLGKNDEAIIEFRIRVRNKKSANDLFVLEAKKGLRMIFEDSAIIRRYAEKEGMLSDSLIILKK